MTLRKLTVFTLCQFTRASLTPTTSAKIGRSRSLWPIPASTAYCTLYDGVMTTADCVSRRLGSVVGAGDKANDVLSFCGPDPEPGRTRRLKGHVVFFGGDTQDYPENMQSHRDNHRYVDWSLENTGRRLTARFPDQHVWIVKSRNMYLKTFSVYDNFVQSNAIGCPEHSPGQESWTHLAELLTKAIQLDGCVGYGPDVPVSLVGFSKGCVVLNQLLYDLAQAKAEQTTRLLVDSVRAMYWLDGGHNGGSDVWITDESVLGQLAGTQIIVHSHVTPYQVKDTMRTWIGKEQKKFVAKARKVATVHNTLHFEDEERSIENHFKVLTVF